MKLNAGSNKKWMFLFTLLFSAVNLAGAQNAGLVEVNPDMFRTMKWVMLGLLAVILILLVISRQVSEYRAAILVSGSKEDPSPGRNSSQGYREFLTILSLGAIGIAGAFLIGLKPAPASASGPPAEDSTKELTTAEMIVSKDAAIIQTGKDKFQSLCVSCHGASAEGNAVGPNLTDDYWLHGGAAPNLYKVITDGVPEKGMLSWKGAVKPKERIAVISYIKSLAGSNPANAKAPQGELWKEGMQDSLKKDGVPADTAASQKNK